MTEPTFVPWVRRGLARGIAVVDPLSGPLAANPSITVEVDIADDRGQTISAAQPQLLVGPGDVAGLDVSSVLRYEPPQGTSDFESNYFPFVELIAPDLPWMLTPAAPTDDDALRPWIVLVVVEERDGVTFDAGTPTATAALTVDGALVADELWDLADSHVWSHVQATVSSGDIGSSVEAGDGRVIARLMCPRKLEPSRTYRGALVPAFVRGADTSELRPAWDLDDGNQPVTLPVFATWTFSTSEHAGDFETLCGRLAPDTESGRLGYQGAVIDDGDLLPAPPKGTELGFEYAGALVDIGSVGVALDRAAQSWFTDGLTPHLERAADRTVLSPSGRAYVPERDDPVVGPPHYGSLASGSAEVETSGWQRETNVDAPSRSAAGLGGEVVRHGQHDFLAAAWDQVGALREVRSELNESRLTAEIAERHVSRLRELDDGGLLFAVGEASSFVAFQDTSARDALERSKIVPTAVVSSTFFRAARSSGSVGRVIGDARSEPSLASRVSATFIDASSDTSASSLIAVTKFGSSFVPAGAFTSSTDVSVLDGFAGKLAVVDGEVRLDLGASGAATSSTVGRSALLDRTAPRARRAAGSTIELPDVIAVEDRSTGDDVSAVAAAVRGNLQPASSVAAGLKQRVTGVAIDTELPIPTRVVVGPWFPDGLADRLQELSVDYLLPGVGDVDMNRVRLLQVNERFVEAFLVGANHEWAREALWREFPADLAATAFASLFDRPGDPQAPGDDTDLATDIHGWKTKELLGSHVGDTGTSTVVLLRAEVVRRYPGLVVTLLEPDGGEVPLSSDGVLDADRVRLPVFRGSVDDSTIFVGFDVSPDVVVDQNWFVAIEEPITGPRFGLDTAAGAESGTPPRKWENLTWGHVAAAGNTGPHIRLSSLGWEGIRHQSKTWARNGAHQAGITYQRPFRMVFPAHALLGGT